MSFEPRISFALVCSANSMLVVAQKACRRISSFILYGTAVDEFLPKKRNVRSPPAILQSQPKKHYVPHLIISQSKGTRWGDLWVGSIVPQ